MTPQEHYVEAENAIVAAGGHPLGSEMEKWNMNRAKVHAIIALYPGELPEES